MARRKSVVAAKLHVSNVRALKEFNRRPIDWQAYSSQQDLTRERSTERRARDSAWQFYIREMAKRARMLRAGMHDALAAREELFPIARLDPRDPAYTP